MKYSFDSRIRYSETGMDGRLTLHGILNYFQDCSIFHSEMAGRGLRSLEKTKKVWVLQSWQIEVGRYPAFCESIRVSTWPSDFKGFFGSRNFIMETENQERIAWANSVWVFLDMETGRPVRVTEEERRAYPLEEKLDMEYAGRKILLPEGGAVQEPITVMTENLDTNHHVNNGQYVKLAMRYLPADFKVRRLRAEYKRQARLGEVMIPRVVQEPDRCHVVLEGADGKADVIVEFEAKE